jgi:ABC-2 type transport system permease protein
MRSILALAGKDLRILMRDRTGFFFSLMWPLIIAIFFGTIFGGGGDEGGSAIPIMVVDQDSTEASRAFVAQLEGASELKVTPATLEEAVDQVRRGRKTAFVVIKRGFGRASENPFWGDPPTVELGTDPARRAEAGMIEGILMKYASQRLETFFANSGRQRESISDAREAIRNDAGMDPAVRRHFESFFGALDNFIDEQDQLAQTDTTYAEAGGLGGFTPLEVEHADITVERRWPTNAYAISFPQGIAWGLIGVAAGFGISLVTERTRGTLVRLQTAPISRTTILAGKATACLATTVTVSFALLLVGRFVFGLRPSSIGLVVFAVISSAVAFAGIMMLLAVLGKTEQAAGGIGWAVLIVMAMLGGGMIPLFVLPSWMRTVSNVSPVKWSILALEGAVWRQFSFQEMLLPCGILIAVGVVFFVIGTRAFDWVQQS